MVRSSGSRVFVVVQELKSIPSDSSEMMIVGNENGKFVLDIKVIFNVILTRVFMGLKPNIFINNFSVG